MRAEAIALTLSYRSFAEAAKEMAVRHPERPPSRELIRYWLKQQDPATFRALSQERQERFTERVFDIALLSADKLEEEIEAGNIKGQPLAITYGISSDKVLKLRELSQRSRESEAGQALAEAINRMASLSMPQLHAIIEGEVVSSTGENEVTPSIADTLSKGRLA